MFVCKSCGSQVDTKFSFCLRENKCPVCGGVIDDSGKTSVYLDLFNIVKTEISNLIICNKIASDIFGAFDLMPKSVILGQQNKKEQPIVVLEKKQELVSENKMQNGPEQAVLNNENVVNDEIPKEPVSVKDKDGILYETIDKKKAREIAERIKRFQEENEYPEDDSQYDLSGLGDLVNSNPTDNMQQKLYQAEMLKKKQRLDAIESGITVGGAKSFVRRAG